MKETRIIPSVFIILLLVFLFSCTSKEEKQERYCWNCGDNISISARFCESCGSNLSKVDSTKDDYTYEDYINEKQSSNTTTTILSDYNRIPTQDNYEYKTTCLAVGCDNIPNSLNFYCSEHACAQNGCSSERSYTSSFCNRHKCDAMNCDNGSNEWGNYCSEHACAENNCTGEKNYGHSSIFCSYHECNEVMCNNRKKDYGYYCSEHECAERHCTSQKAVLSDYCYIHDD